MTFSIFSPMRLSACGSLKASKYALSVASNIRKTVVCCTSTRYFAIESSLPVLTMFTKVSQRPFDDYGHFQVTCRQGNSPNYNISWEKVGRQLFTGLLQESKTKRCNVECSNLPLKSECVQQGILMIFLRGVLCAFYLLRKSVRSVTKLRPFYKITRAGLVVWTYFVHWFKIPVTERNALGYRFNITWQQWPMLFSLKSLLYSSWLWTCQRSSNL